MASFVVEIIALILNLIIHPKTSIDNYLLFSIGILISILPLGIILLKTMYITIIKRKL